MYIRKEKLGIKGLSIIVDNELKALMANKHIIYGNLLSPVLYFLFFSFGIQSTFGDIEYNGEIVSYLSYSMIGIFAMIIFKEMYQCVYRVMIDRRWGLLSLKMLNGISSPLYIIGISTFPIIGVLAQVTVVYILSIIFGGAIPLNNFLGVVLLLILCILFWSSLLLCIALSIKNYKQRDFIMNTAMLPVMFSAPLFFSLDNAPFLIQVISALNPLTYQLGAMRSIAFGLMRIDAIIIALTLVLIAFIVANILLNRADLNVSEH